MPSQDDNPAPLQSTAACQAGDANLDPASNPTSHHVPPQEGRGPRGQRFRRLAIAAVVVLLFGLGCYYGLPWLEKCFTRVSTDDAYVSGYVTYLGPRIASRVDAVLKHEDDFIHCGETLVRLDPEPYRVAVAQAEANLQLARANLAQARTTVRAQLAAARANEYLVRSAIDQVRYQIASLQSAIAGLKLDESKQVLAEKEFARVVGLVKPGAASQEDYDQRHANLQVARDQVNSQGEIVQQARAQLGLPRNTKNPSELPKDLESQNPQIQTARSNWATSLVQIGIPLDIAGLAPETLDRQLDPWRIERLSREQAAAIVDDAPAVQVARAAVRQMEAVLERAKLNLSYTEIKAPFDGFVTKRSAKSRRLYRARAEPPGGAIAARRLGGRQLQGDGPQGPAHRHARGHLRGCLSRQGLLRSRDRFQSCHRRPASASAS